MFTDTSFFQASVWHRLSPPRKTRPQRSQRSEMLRCSQTPALRPRPGRQRRKPHQARLAASYVQARRAVLEAISVRISRFAGGYGKLHAARRRCARHIGRVSPPTFHAPMRAAIFLANGMNGRPVSRVHEVVTGHPMTDRSIPQPQAGGRKGCTNIRIPNARPATMTVSSGAIAGIRPRAAVAHCPRIFRRRSRKCPSSFGE